MTPVLVNSSSASLSNQATSDDTTGLLVSVVVVLGILLCIMTTIVLIGCYLRGRCFGTAAKTRRMPGIRRARATPRMVKVSTGHASGNLGVRGIRARAPEGFGLSEDEISQFNASSKHDDTELVVAQEYL